MRKSISVVLASAQLLGACGNDTHDKQADNKEHSKTTASDKKKEKKQDKKENHKEYLDDLRYFVSSYAESARSFGKHVSQVDEDTDLDSFAEHFDTLSDQLDENLDDFKEEKHDYKPNDKEKKVENHFTDVSKTLSKESRDLSQTLKDYNEDKVSDDKVDEQYETFVNKLDKLADKEVDEDDFREVLGDKVYGLAVDE